MEAVEPASTSARGEEHAALRWPGLIGGRLGYRLLRHIAPSAESSRAEGAAYAGRSKLEALLGRELWQTVAGKVVIDFGCGDGADAVELACRGASRVIGIDIRDRVLAVARARAAQHGVDDRCVFTTTTTERADVITSVDAFEHFADPAGVLQTMRTHVKDRGCVLIAFGPPWLHPLGGHLFSVFPWAHLVFTETALLRWRSHFKTDGATRFSEVEGGLNQMTIRRFRRLIETSPFRTATLEMVPIRRTRWMHNRLTSEFFTSIVRCRLVPRGGVA